MTASISGIGTFTGDLSALREMQESLWATELARLKEMSLITGGEVVYNLAMFGLEWSPAFVHSSDLPVAWVNGITGERREGAQDPNAIDETPE